MALDGTMNVPLTITPSPMTTLSRESDGFDICAPWGGILVKNRATSPPSCTQMWFKGEMNPNVYNNLGASLNERFWQNSRPVQARRIAQQLKKKSFVLFTERHN
jgi:hypothetical protein